MSSLKVVGRTPSSCAKPVAMFAAEQSSRGNTNKGLPWRPTTSHALECCTSVIPNLRLPILISGSKTGEDAPTWVGLLTTQMSSRKAAFAQRLVLTQGEEQWQQRIVLFTTLSLIDVVHRTRMIFSQKNMEGLPHNVSTKGQCLASTWNPPQLHTHRSSLETRSWLGGRHRTKPAVRESHTYCPPVWRT